MSFPPARILIAGGGFAAVEAALALKALAADEVSLTMISPESALWDRPAATLEALTEGTPRRYALSDLAADIGFEHHKALLESVAPQRRAVRSSLGARWTYDALILATGARATAGIPGALTFRDQRDLPLVRQLVGEVEAGAVQSAVFAVPSGCSWPLPIYELALHVAGRARDCGAPTQVTLVTPEPDPLSLFGGEVSRLIAGLLDERGIALISSTVPAAVRRDGALSLHPGGAVAADRVIAAPALRGRRITGVPARWWGFVPTDRQGRVERLPDVYAAGDVTTFPIKQGGLATQQADRIAHVIASGLGAPVKELRVGHVLRARLLGGEQPVFLRAELDEWGQTTTATLERHEKRESATMPKVFGRYLTPYLESLETDRRAAA